MGSLEREKQCLPLALFSPLEMKAEIGEWPQEVVCYRARDETGTFEGEENSEGKE